MPSGPRLPEVVDEVNPLEHWWIARPILYAVLGMTGEQELDDTEALVARVAGVLTKEVERAITIGCAEAVGELVTKDYRLVLNPDNEKAAEAAGAAAFVTATGVLLAREDLATLVAAQQEIDSKNKAFEEMIHDLRGW